MPDTPDRSYRIALIPGDGIGREVVPEGVRALQAAAERFGFEIATDGYDYSCERWLETGAMMPEDGLEPLREADAILLGAVGDPRVPDHASLWGLLIPIRRAFDQYVNLRPARLLPGVRNPLAHTPRDALDMMVVRENSEGEYSEIGGRIFRGSEREQATQVAVFTRTGVDRVLHYAFALAAERRGRLTSTTKSNGIVHSMPFWDERVRAVAGAHPDIEVESMHADALAARMILDPARFDVIVASNLFGDVLSEIGAALSGSIGIMPSANINPERAFPSMFEPIHGSAPDIAGQGIANPVGTLWSVAMMLEHLGEADAAAAMMAAVEAATADPATRTGDLGGEADTRTATDAVIAHLRQPATRT